MLNLLSQSIYLNLIKLIYPSFFLFPPFSLFAILRFKSAHLPTNLMYSIIQSFNFAFSRSQTFFIFLSLFNKVGLHFMSYVIQLLILRSKISIFYMQGVVLLFISLERLSKFLQFRLKLQYKVLLRLLLIWQSLFISFVYLWHFEFILSQTHKINLLPFLQTSDFFSWSFHLLYFDVYLPFELIIFLFPSILF